MLYRPLLSTGISNIINFEFLGGGFSPNNNNNHDWVMNRGPDVSNKWIVGAGNHRENPAENLQSARYQNSNVTSSEIGTYNDNGNEGAVCLWTYNGVTGTGSASFGTTWAGSVDRACGCFAQIQLNDASAPTVFSTNGAPPLAIAGITLPPGGLGVVIGHARRNSGSAAPFMNFTGSAQPMMAGQHNNGGDETGIGLAMGTIIQGGTVTMGSTQSPENGVLVVAVFNPAA